MYYKSLLIIVLVCPTIVFGQIPRAVPPVPENTAKYQLSRVKELHEGILKEVDNRLTEIKNMIKDKEVRRDKKKYQFLKKERTRLENISRAMKKGQAPYLIVLDPLKFKARQIGYFENNNHITGVLTIADVIDESTLLLDHKVMRGGYSGSHWKYCPSFLLCDYPTTGLVNGTEINLTEIYEVVDTQKVSGTTVMKLRCYSMKAMNTYLTSLKKNKK